jgi:hypothetical protein
MKASLCRLRRFACSIWRHLPNPGDKAGGISCNGGENISGNAGHARRKVTGAFGAS